LEEKKIKDRNKETKNNNEKRRKYGKRMKVRR
jgi:hypothetical protein